MNLRYDYEHPFHWWGPGPVPAAPLDLPVLIGNGTIRLDDAAVLCAAVSQRRSLSVIGGPSGVGKSTLLHALVPWLAQETRAVYLRGCYESFAFLGQPHYPPRSTALLVNEISPHLPIYLWGQAVGRSLAAAERGYQLLATAHGRDILDFVASLTTRPLSLPARALSAFDLVALLEPMVDGSERRLTRIWELSPAPREGLMFDEVGMERLPSGVAPEAVAKMRTTLEEASGLWPSPQETL